MSNTSVRSEDTSVAKKLYYDNGESINPILTRVELDEHNKDENAHKNVFNKYILDSPIGLFNAFHNLGKNYCPKLGGSKNETTEAYASAGCFISTYDTLNVINNQPSQFGQLINFPSAIDTNGDIRVTQLWLDGYNGFVLSRTGSRSNKIGDMKFDRFMLNSDNEIVRAGAEFPDVSLCDVGTIFYRKDTHIMYVLFSKVPDAKWVPIIDVDTPMGTAERLSNPWLTLAPYMGDSSIKKIEKNTDLDSLNSAGVYTCIGSSYAATLKNCPYNEGNFRLVVQLNRDMWGMQLLYAGNHNRIYTRGFISKDNNVTFTNWDMLIHKNDEVTKAVRSDLDGDGNKFSDTYVKFKPDSTTQTIDGNIILQDKQIDDPSQDINSIVLKASHQDKYIKNIAFTNSNGDIISIIKATYNAIDSANKKSIELVDIISGCSIGVVNENNVGYVYINGKSKFNNDVDVTGTVKAERFDGKIKSSESVSADIITKDQTDLVVAHGASNDLFRIVSNQQAEQSIFRYVGFETADGANSEIRFSQREIGDKSKGMFGAEINTAVILDRKGNTKFPGVVTAKNITAPESNDYAEFFERGEDTEPGDIIVLDTSSDTERYIKSTNSDDIVVGVHSDEFAYIIGGDKSDDPIEDNMKKYIPVSLTGRVYVKVIGKVKKGDIIIPSNVSGIGIVSDNKVSLTNMVGISLESSNDINIKKIRVLIKK